MHRLLHTGVELNGRRVDRLQIAVRRSSHLRGSFSIEHVCSLTLI